MKVKLESIVEAIDFDCDERSEYVDLKTGKVVSVSEEAVSELESDDASSNEADWWQSELAVARAYLESPDSYTELPCKYDFNEYRVMQHFIGGLDDDAARAKLEDKIRGGGAFRRFKDALYDLDIVKDWYDYKQQRLEAFVREWCEEEGFEVE